MCSTRARHLLAGAITAALLGCTLAFAPAPAASPLVTDAPDIGVRTTGSGTLHEVDGLPTALGFEPDDDLTDPAAHVRAARRLAEAAGLETVAADPELCIEECEEPCSDECAEPSVEEYVDGLAIGDVDGDGRDDVGVFRSRFDWETLEEHGSFEVRSGVDGALLWHDEPDASSFYARVPDLDGDGADDLLAFGYGLVMNSHGGSCDVVTCTFVERYEAAITYGFVSGATGDELGTLQTSESLTYEQTTTGTSAVGGPGDAVADVIEATFEADGWLTALSIVDLDGDGAHQFLLGTIDVGYDDTAVVAGTSTPTYAEVFGADLNTTLGGDVLLHDVAGGGTEVVRSSDAEGVPYAYVVTESDGGTVLVLDTYHEVARFQVGCAYVEDTAEECGDSRDLPTSEPAPAPTRELLDGDLAVRWTGTASPGTFDVYGAGGDLDGDGTEDLFELRLGDHDLETIAIDGATGAEGWRTTATTAVVRGDSVLAVAYRDASTEDTWRYAVDGLLLDPADGTVRSERELAVEESSVDGDVWTESYVFVSFLPIAGDLDLLVETQSWTYREGEEHCETFEDEHGTWEECWTEYEVIDWNATTRGASGADLGDLFLLDGRDVYLDAIADLDGDGARELVVTDCAAACTSTAQGLDGTVLWTDDSDRYITGLLGAPDGVDLIVLDFGVDPVAVGVVDGATAAAVWSTT